jgi:hypothetical protein
MQKRILIICFVLIFTIGCAASSKILNKIDIGMTKAEVIELLGEPNYTSAVNDVEILTYKLKSGSFFTDTFQVKIRNGKVERFGQNGSFGSYY